MRWTACGWGMAAMALVSCGTPARRDAATTAKNPAYGVILAVRPVPVGTMEPVPVGTMEPVPVGTMEPGPVGNIERPPAGTMEYVVRTEDGATVAVVQPADPRLRQGMPVAIGRGERATLAAR